MAQLKHVGRVVNTGRRCIVVFREIYDDRGNVIDDQNCLIVETDSLPDAEHQDLMRIVESGPAQSTGDVFNVFARERIGSGQLALNWMAKTNRLRKYPTNNIELTPDSSTSIRLDTLNKIVKMQKTGTSQEDIQKVLQDDTDLPPRETRNVVEGLKEDPVDVVQSPAEPTQTGEAVLDDSELAKTYLTQAEVFENQAQELRAQAYEMDPNLKPKTTKKTAQQKAPAKNKA